MKPPVKSKLEKIFNYPFFTTIGEPLPHTVSQIGNWNDAAINSNSLKWRNCKLSARNLLQETVQQKSWERMQEWNPLADELRPIILPFVDRLLSKAPINEKEHEGVRNGITWDIMFICFETEYGDLTEIAFYTPCLDCWYAEGHFPCGWDGKMFPENWDGSVHNGKLMVF